MSEQEKRASEVFEIITGRRTTHFYEDRPLPEGSIERALQAAIRAPNHKLTNPWRFLRAGAKTRAAVTDLGVELKCGEGAPEGRRKKVRQKYTRPAELIIVSQMIDSDSMRRKEDYASVACAIQNMSLVLWAQGIGSKWSTGKVTRDARTYALCEVDPEREEIVGFFWVGYPEHTSEAPRRPLEEVYRELP